MIISSDVSAISNVIAEMKSWLDQFRGLDIADLDDRQLGANALKLAQFASDVAEAFDEAGFPHPESTVASLLGWAGRCQAEIEARIAARAG